MTATTGRATSAAEAEPQRRVQALTRISRLLVGAVAVLAVALVAVIWVTTGDDVQRKIDASQEVADALSDAVEAADAGGVGAHFADDALFEDPAARTAVTGRVAIGSLYAGFLNADSPIENTAVFVGPGFAVTEFVWTQPCTFVACASELFGEPVPVRGVVLHVIEDGEVVRETDYIAYPRSLLLP